MKIEEILQLLSSTDSESLNNAIKQLKGKTKEIAIDDIRKQLDPLGHDIMSTIKRPNKKVKKSNDDQETEELVSRIPLALQKLIVDRIVGFTFGFNPKVKAEPKDDAEKLLLDSVKDVLNISKCGSLNSELAEDLYSCTQVAEYWRAVELPEKQLIYGFESIAKLKNYVFSPLRGDNLYPFFDEFGDMVAFSREYMRQTVDGDFKYFDVYTDTKVVSIDITKTPIVLSNVKNDLGKIPVVFAEQPNVEWYVVQKVIERLETLMSNFADTNDYNGSPILFGSGSLSTAPGKANTGKFITGSGQGADLKYVSWEQAPESIKLEIETLYNIIYGFTQTPNITFENVKGIGTTSGVALKLLFMDAHLKVQSKRKIWDNYFIRRVNIIKEYLAILNPTFAKVKNMFIELEIIPYTIIDWKEVYDYLNIANGGKPVVSHRTSIEMTGFVDDVDGELEKIKLEEKESQLIDAFPQNQ